VVRLAWAQEVPSSNLGAPTTSFIFSERTSIASRKYKSGIFATAHEKE
jgi:hypothetical protein